VHAFIQGTKELTGDPLAAAALETCFRVLEAVAQLSMEVGLGIGDIRSLSDSAFISAAQTLLAEDPGADPDNVAMLAVRTGFNRATVGKLLKIRPDSERDKPFQHHTARVMRAWQSSAGYFEGKGIPKILPIRGDAPSFYALTKATLGDDLPPKLILKDLQRIGAIKAVPNKQVQLIRTTYGNANWDCKQVKQIGEEVSDHFRAILQLLKKQHPIPFRRYITRAGLGLENAGILARELTNRVDVAMDVHSRALEHETHNSKGIPGQKHRLSALTVILMEPDSPQTQRSRPRRSRAKRAVKPSAAARSKKV